MTDVFTPDKRSAVMARVKCKDTGPEMVVRRMLWRLGARYRLHRRDLPGAPDIVLSGRRLVIFVHGCFWHGHDCARGARVPKANRDYWLAKVSRNRIRDADGRTRLEAGGWRVEVVWECELKDRVRLEERLAGELAADGAARASRPSCNAVLISSGCPRRGGITMARMEIGPAIAAALSGIGPGWRRAGGALALVVGLAGLNQYASQVGQASDRGLFLPVVVASTGVGIMAKGALYRLALEPDHMGDASYRTGPFGLQWRDFEWRVLGGSLLVNFIMTIALVVAALVWAIYLGVVVQARLIDTNSFADDAASPSGRVAALFSMLFASPAGLISLLILSIALAIVLYVAARLSVAPIMAGDGRRFDLRAAWTLTRGAGLAIILTWAVILLMVFGAGLVGGLVGGLAAGLSGAHQAAKWGAIGGGMAAAAIISPASAGLSAYVYRLRARRPGVAEVFS